MQRKLLKEMNYAECKEILRRYSENPQSFPPHEMNTVLRAGRFVRDSEIPMKNVDTGNFIDNLVAKIDGNELTSKPKVNKSKNECLKHNRLFGILKTGGGNLTKKQIIAKYEEMYNGQTVSVRTVLHTAKNICVKIKAEANLDNKRCEYKKRYELIGPLLPSIFCIEDLAKAGDRFGISRKACKYTNTKWEEAGFVKKLAKNSYKKIK